MKEGPIVSVCMPAYNAGKYIRQAVSSVLEQSYQNIELIVVNDGSTDDTAEELEKIKDNRLFVINQINTGQSAAANNAYNKASGSLIKFMDADDIISNNFIRAQVNQLGGRCDAVASAAWGRFYNDDIETFKLSPQGVWKDMLPQGWLTSSWQNGDTMMQCALWLIPKQILENSGLWDEQLSLINDLDFFTRILLACKQVLFAPDAVLYYRSGLRGSLSDTKHRDAVMSAFTAMDKATYNLLAINSSDEARLACANVWQSFVYNYYPHQPDLIARAQKKVNELGGSSLKFESGGATKLLGSILGWRIVQKLKTLINA